MHLQNNNNNKYTDKYTGLFLQFPTTKICNYPNIEILKFDITIKKIKKFKLV